MRSFYHISVMIARGISESVMIAGRISQSSCRSRLSPPLWCPAGGLPPAALAVPAAVVSAGGLAFLLPCLPCLWFAFLPPIPPAPFPGGEGGALRLFYARGFAPCIPGAEPARHWLALPLWCPAGGLPPAALARPAAVVPGGVAQEGRSPADLAIPAPAGGLAFFVACQPCLWFTFLPPIPPTPFPGGEGGDYKFISPGASPPAPLH